MAYDPVTGSVVAFQSNPENLQVSITGTVTITNPVNSVVAIINSIPSIATNIQGSVAAVIIGGSIAASFTPPANQSVSGTVGASVIGNVNTTITSIATGLGVMPILSNNTLTPADGNNYAIQEAMGSGGNQLALTVGNYGFNFNGSNWDRVRGNSSIGTLVSTGASSVITVTTFPANQSVSGTIGASIIGLTPVSVSNFPVNQSVLQGTNPWVVTSSIAGGIFPVSGSVAAVVTNVVNVNATGSVATIQSTSPWVVNFQNSSIIGINAGSVVTISSGSVITVLQSSSILAVPVGSVITINQGSSIITKWADSSVLASQQGTWRVSVVGTYATGAASVVSGIGIQTLGLRNDTLASIYGTNGTYSPQTYGPVGEGIVANAPITKWVNGTATFLTSFGPQVSVLNGGGAGVFNYMTSYQVTNFSANSVLGTWMTSTSVIGYFTAPASSGSNVIMPNAIKSTSGQGIGASVSGISSVYVSAQGFVSNT